MRIGELAERTGLSLRTIRFYEEVGVLAPAHRTKGGFRQYNDGDMQRLLLERSMKPLGFTVEEMRNLLEAIEVLAADEIDPSRVEALQLMQGYQIRVDERAAALREQAGQAQQFAEDLGARIARTTEVAR